MCDENLLKLWKLVGFQKKFDPKCFGNFFKKKNLLLFFQKFWTCKLFLKNLVGLFYLKILLGFLVKILANFLKTCMFFENFWTRNLLRILLNFLLKILIFLPKFVNNVGHSWNDLVMSFENLIKTLLGFLMKILANFLKVCLFFENFWTWNLLKILLNFLLKILIFLSKFVFVKTCWLFLEWSCHVFWKFEKNLVGYLWKLCNIVKRSFSKRCLKFLQDFPQLLKKMLKLSENLVWFLEKVMKTLFWKIVDKPCWVFFLKILFTNLVGFWEFY